MHCMPGEAISIVDNPRFKLHSNNFRVAKKKKKNSWTNSFFLVKDVGGNLLGSVVHEGERTAFIAEVNSRWFH